MEAPETLKLSIFVVIFIFEWPYFTYVRSAAWKQVGKFIFTRNNKIVTPVKIIFKISCLLLLTRCLYKNAIFIHFYHRSISLLLLQCLMGYGSYSLNCYVDMNGSHRYVTHFLAISVIYKGFYIAEHEFRLNHMAGHT